ncbi:hypothetical protein YC2023_027139 [Brassica napus]
MDLTINGVTETWINKESPSTAIQKFWTWCTECMAWYRLHRSFFHMSNTCRSCNKEFYAREIPRQGLLPGKDSSSKDIMHKRVLIKRLCGIQQSHPVASNTRPSFWTSCRDCGHRERFLKLYVDKWFVCEKCHGETIAMEVLARSGEALFNKLFLELKPGSKKNYSSGLSCGVKVVGEKRKREEVAANGDEASSSGNDVLDKAVDNNRRGFNDDGDAAGRLEASEWGKQLCKRKRNELGGSNDDSAGLKFNDFEKLRKEVNFSVGETWALYDQVDGMPRLYARIRKVSAPSFGLRITHLEPDPDDEREVLWFDQDLPVSTGQFRLGKNENTKDCSLFSHVIHCKEGSNTGHLIVSPRKGETWALFKNWDIIKWSSEPDSHSSYKYEIVEILSDHADGTGVSVAFLHKAKGFASVFFRMGTGDDSDMIQVPSHSLYRFSHMIPSFKLTGTEAKGLPKDAYELDQAALPATTVQEKPVPSHLIPVPKPEALCLPSSEGKVIKTGQFWAFGGDYDDTPRYYGRIQKITVTQTFEQTAETKVHVCRLKATSFPQNVIKWKDKSMPVGCGTFSMLKNCSTLYPQHLTHQIFPQTSMDGNECTILPKVGQLWVIYRLWAPHFEEHDLDFEVVEVLDDALNYKVLALERALVTSEEKNHFFRAAKSRPSYCHEEDGTGVIFTIPQSKMLRFSHPLPASRVTKEVDGEMEVLFEVDKKALPLGP